jgi:hypothetical protein
MPTVRQALEYYKKAVREGKADMHTGHPYIAEEEARKREDNPVDPLSKKQKTKVAFETNDPDSYAEWHVERARWMKAANKNPALSTDAMIVALKLYSQQEIDMFVTKVGESRARIEAAKAAAAGIPPAIIPREVGQVE